MERRCEKHLTPDDIAAMIDMPSSCDNESEDCNIPGNSEIISDQTAIGLTKDQADAPECSYSYTQMKPSFCRPLFDIDNQDSEDEINDPTYRPSEDEEAEVEIEVSAAVAMPEDFVVDGANEEIGTRSPKRKRINKEKEAKRQRNSGVEYRSRKGVLVPGKRGILFPRCQGDGCKKQGKTCHLLLDEKRRDINTAFYNLGDLRLQRSFITAHVKSVSKKCCKSKSERSRREKTNVYCLPDGNGNDVMPVCKKLFLSTLSMKSDRSVRTALAKMQDGAVASEGRGGRNEQQIENDSLLRKTVEDHINKFPRVESHYCRRESVKEYLHPGLNLAMMHRMYLETPNVPQVSLSLYQNVFHSKNLAFHKPKKDMCGLCKVVQDIGGVGKVQDQELAQRYIVHIAEKEEVRKRKTEAKKLAEESDDHGAAIFDLQQVMYTPSGNHSAIFYKRRLANYNFTVYNLKNKEGMCQIWHECIAGRGSCEISTGVYNFLKNCDEAGLKTVELFSDGCAGQNKNSIVPCMIRYFLSQSVNSEQVTLNFFEVDHGQSECDSMHSVVQRNFDRVGEVQVPSQIAIIVKTAKRKPPYKVYELQTSDVLDWKSLCTSQQFLKNRLCDSGEPMNWTKVKVFHLRKNEPHKIFFKRMHRDKDFDSITLPIKRLTTPADVQERLKPLYSRAPPLSAGKYLDLKQLCTGETGVVRQEDYKQFYLNLPHN